MANSHIKTRERARNPYHLEDDTPGANALLVREREWWAKPAVRENYPVPVPQSRTATLPQTAAKSVRFIPPMGIDWRLILYLASFILGIVCNEKFGDHYSAGFVGDLLAGLLFGVTALLAVVCSLRLYLIWMTLIYFCLGFAFAIWKALHG